MPLCCAKQEFAFKKKRRERGKLNRGAKIELQGEKTEFYAGGTSVTS